MNKDEIIDMAKQAGCGHEAIDLHWVYPENLEAFAKLVAQHERDVCAYQAGIALLGADRGLSNRVDQAIRARTES
jgi:hypothetical protein